MAKEFRNTEEFRDAFFWHVDISGTVFRACDVNDVKIVGSDITNLRVEGHAGRAGRVFVDGVDVTAYVDAELDRRFPELVGMREMKSADDCRSMWVMTQSLWAETVDRARRLPEQVLNERVEDEWSFIETLRHLIFATDVWVERMMHGVDLPFHRIALPTTGYPPEGARELGLDVEARPTLDEVLQVHADRRGKMSREVASATDNGLEVAHTNRPAPAWGETTATVRDCLFTVIEEHLQHRRFAVRDLAVLEAR